MGKSLQELIDEASKNTEIKVEEVKKEEPKKIEEKKSQIIEKKEEKYIGRGFKTIKDAEEFIKSEVFLKWHPHDQEELKTWLKKIKED